MKVLLVEDEYMVAKRLSRFVEKGLEDKLTSLKAVSDLEDAQDFLAANTVDVVFLDLNLNGNDGFELLREQLCKSFHIIVVSANTDRAIEAFEHGVLDFIAKPFTQERIDKAVSRLLEQQNSHGCKYLSYKKLGELKLLAVADIVYLKAEGHYTDVIDVNGDTSLHDKSLEKILLLLGNTFIRIHRSYAVQLGEIESLRSETGSKYWLTMSNGDELPVGRTRIKALKAIFA